MCQIPASIENGQWPRRLSLWPKWFFFLHRHVVALAEFSSIFRLLVYEVQVTCISKQMSWLFRAESLRHLPLRQVASICESVGWSPTCWALSAWLAWLHAQSWPVCLAYVLHTVGSLKQESHRVEAKSMWLGGGVCFVWRTKLGPSFLLVDGMALNLKKYHRPWPYLTVCRASFHWDLIGPPASLV